MWLLKSSYFICFIIFDTRNTSISSILLREGLTLSSDQFATPSSQSSCLALLSAQITGISYHVLPAIFHLDNIYLPQNLRKNICNYNRLQNVSWGLESWLSFKSMHCSCTIWFPAPTSDSSKPPETPVPGVWCLCTPQAPTHHLIKNKVTLSENCILHYSAALENTACKGLKWTGVLINQQKQLAL